MLDRVREQRAPWDLAIIGGGATGVGIAVDGASRGYSVLLLEQHDFGKGTSSRSTKLIHGGVRYLQQGNLSLVQEGLRERWLLRQNAPHLVQIRPFIVPNYRWWNAAYYGLGLKGYDLLAGRYGLGRTELLSRSEILERIPTLRTDGLRGGVVYYDGQFDDTRLLINLVQTAAEHGACVINYARVIRLTKDTRGAISGVVLIDNEREEVHTVHARCVINATGAFCDEVRSLDDASSRPLVTPSQGTHLVFDRSFLPGESALMVPRTKDGRVMFAIPWHAHVLVGTTDTAIDRVTLEPRPLESELEFLLETTSAYLANPVRREDILSAFAGVRPLVRADAVKSTARLLRDHKIQISSSGLITITGGKWTTYRKMAEDVVDRASQLAGLPQHKCLTPELRIHGYMPPGDPTGAFSAYGSDGRALQELIAKEPRLDERLHPALPLQNAQVIWAVRNEMARSVEDVLARRTRALFLNSRAALEAAPSVAALIAQEFGRGKAWARNEVLQFEALAKGYLPPCIGRHLSPS